MHYIHGGDVSDKIRPFLLAPFLSEVSIHANTSGVFKGFTRTPKLALVNLEEMARMLWLEFWARLKSKSLSLVIFLAIGKCIMKTSMFLLKACQK